MCIFGVRVSGARRPGILVMALISLVSCQGSLDLLSSDDRDELYSVVVEQRSEKLSDGAIVTASAPLKVIPNVLSGTPAPWSVSLSLESMNGTTVRSASFLDRTRVVGEKPTDPSITVMDALTGVALALPVPETMPDGAYRLVCRFGGARGEILYSRTLTVFKLSGTPPEADVGIFPPSFGKGEAGVVIAVVRARPGLAPYLRWSDGVTTLAAGSASEVDRIVWRAPGSEGAATIFLDVYPFPPPAGGQFSFKAPIRKTVKVLVAGHKVPADLLAKGEGFSALYRFEGDASDVANPRSPVTFFGSPYLDVNASGFGYRLGARPEGGTDAWKYRGAGVRIEGASLPVRYGRLAPFSFVARLDPESGSDGSIVSYRFESGQTITLSLARLVPQLTFGFSSRSVSLAAAEPLAFGRSSTLVVSVLPTGGQITAEFFVDGRFVGSQTAVADLSTWTFDGTAVIGGLDGCPALYDAFGVYSGPQSALGEPYPAFRDAALSRYRDAVVFASGFESYSTDSALSGRQIRGDRPGAVLPAGGVIRLTRPVEATSAVRVELTARDAIAVDFVDSANTVVSAIISPSGAFSVVSGGNVVASGNVVPDGRVSSGTVSIDIVPSSEGLALRVGTVRVPAALQGTNFRMSLRNLGDVPAEIYSLLVRNARDEVGLRPLHPEILKNPHQARR